MNLNLWICIGVLLAPVSFLMAQNPKTDTAASKSDIAINTEKNILDQAALKPRPVVFRPIFNGKNLENWDGNPKVWRVENGEIVGKTTEALLEKATYLIWQGKELCNFELMVDFKIHGHNSGIMYRSFRNEGKNKWSLGGYQADITYDNKWTGFAFGSHYKCILAKLGQKTVIGDTKFDVRELGKVGDPVNIITHFKKDKWNTYHIIARGNHCKQLINGIVTAEFIDKGINRLRKGVIGLQLHGGKAMEVRFKNILLKDIGKRR